MVRERKAQEDDYLRDRKEGTVDEVIYLSRFFAI